MTIYVIFNGVNKPIGYVKTMEEAIQLCHETPNWPSWNWAKVEEIEKEGNNNGRNL